MTQKTTQILPFFPNCLWFCLLLLPWGYSCQVDYITDEGVYQEVPEVAGTYHLTVMQSNDPSNLNDRSYTPVNLIDKMGCLYVTLVLKADGTFESRYTDLQMEKDASGNYKYTCGPEMRGTSNWSREGNALTMDQNTFLIDGNRLIDARNRESEGIDLVVFTKED